MFYYALLISLHLLSGWLDLAATTDAVQSISKVQMYGFHERISGIIGSNES
jgi:hypothetical protein